MYRLRLFQRYNTKLYLALLCLAIFIEIPQGMQAIHDLRLTFSDYPLLWYNSYNTLLDLWRFLSFFLHQNTSRVPHYIRLILQRP